MIMSLKKLHIITFIKSKYSCPSELTLTNLVVNTKLYQFISSGITPSKSNSTSIGWESVKNG